MRRHLAAVALSVFCVGAAWAGNQTAPLPPSIAPGGVYNPNSEEVPLPPSVAPGGVYNPNAGNIPLPPSVAPGGVFNPNAAQLPLPPSIAPGGVFNPNSTKMPLSSAVAPGGVFNPNSTILPLPQSIAPGGVFDPNAGAIALPPSIAPGGVFNPDSTKMPLSSAVAPGGVFDPTLSIIPQSADIAAAVANNLRSQGFVPLPNQINVIPPGGMPLTSGDLTNPSHTVGSLTFYTLGDTDLYMAALNAVAMMFSATSTSGLYGTTTVNGTTFDFLGPIAAIGMLFSLLFICISGIMKQELRLDQMLVTLILSYAMFVPKTTVVIEDIYTGSVKSVDNVPYGVAVPGALISMFTFNFAKQIETAFTSTSAVQPLVIAGANGTTIGGFANPLKMLLALQSINVCGSNGDICADMVEYTRSCLSDSQGNKIVSDKVFKTPDLLTELFGAPGAGRGIQASMVYRSAYHQGNVGTLPQAQLPEGGLVSCDQGASAIRTDIETYLSNPAGLASNSFATDFAHAMGQRKLGSVTGAIPGVNDSAGSEWKNQLTDLLGTTALLGTAGVAQTTVDARGWTATMIMRNPTFAAYAAANQADRSAAYDVYMTVAMEQFKADAAADGTMFLKTMLPSMTVLTFFFFAFAPIVALLVMVTGLQAIKIVTSYLIFGFWTQSWLPGAAIVNYFIQQQWLSKVTGTGSGVPGGMFAIANQPEMYDIASTQLAVGANMLASVPVVMMALITGSAYGLSHLADKMGASRKGYFDEKGLVPDAMTATNAASALKRDQEAGKAYGYGDRPTPYFQTDLNTAPSFSYQNTASEAEGRSSTLSSAAKTGVASSVNKLHQAMSQSGKTFSWGNAFTDTDTSQLGTDIASKVEQSQGTDWTVKHGDKIDDAKKLAISAAAKALAGANGTMGAAKSAAAASLAGSLEFMGIKGEEAAAITKSLDDSIGASLKKNFGTSEGTTNTKARQVADRSEAAIQNSVGDSTSASTAYGSVKSASEELSKMEQATQTAGFAAQGSSPVSANGANMVTSLESGPFGMSANARANRMQPAMRNLNEKTKGLEGFMTPEGRASLGALRAYAGAGNIRGVFDEASKMANSRDATTAAAGHWAVGAFGATTDTRGKQIAPPGLPESANRTGDHLSQLAGSVRAIEKAVGAKLGGAPGAPPGSELGGKMEAIGTEVGDNSDAIDAKLKKDKGTGTAAVGAQQRSNAAVRAQQPKDARAAQAKVTGQGNDLRTAQITSNYNQSNADAGLPRALLGAFNDFATGQITAAAAYAKIKEVAAAEVLKDEGKSGKGGAAPDPVAPADPNAGKGGAAPATTGAAPAAAPGDPAAAKGGAPVAPAPGSYATAQPPAPAPSGASAGEAAPFPKAPVAAAVSSTVPPTSSAPAAASVPQPAPGTAPKVDVPDSVKAPAGASSGGGGGFASSIVKGLTGPGLWLGLGGAAETYDLAQKAPFLNSTADKLQLGTEKALTFGASVWAGTEAGVAVTAMTAPALGPFSILAGLGTAWAVGSGTSAGIGYLDEKVSNAAGFKTGEQKVRDGKIAAGVMPDGTPDAKTRLEVAKKQPAGQVSTPGQ